VCGGSFLGYPTSMGWCGLDGLSVGVGNFLRRGLKIHQVQLKYTLVV
jgi:hypothetical protein